MRGEQLCVDHLGAGQTGVGRLLAVSVEVPSAEATRAEAMTAEEVSSEELQAEAMPAEVVSVESTLSLQGLRSQIESLSFEPAG